MDKQKTKQYKLKKRKVRIRKMISGTAQRPRLSVFRSNRGMFLQLIDDENAKTLISADIKEAEDIKLEKEESETFGSKELVGYKLGKLIAEKARSKNIESAVFDRSGYKYHGRVKAAADGARNGGLKF
jgi:large subunit ribosomal protein L18